MKNNNIFNSKTHLLALLLMTMINLTQAQTPVGTGFTYQGELMDNGSAANGNYDIILEPFFDETGGTGVVFSTNTILNVPVINGLFNIENVDFGDFIYSNSNTVWIEISMRKTSEGGNYTLLSPRQRIKAVPYAVQSEYSKLANEANTTQLAEKASDLSISGANTGDVLAYNGINWSWSTAISVNGNGSASIGSNLVAPTNGLKVAGDAVFDGDLSQDSNKIGLPKYLANVSCLDGSNSITSNDLTGSNATISVTSSPSIAGYCFVNFPTSLTAKYFFVSTQDNDGANTSCKINSNNTSQLLCQRVDRQGVYEYGSFMIMVY